MRYFYWNVTTITWEVSEEQCPADLTMLVSEQRPRYANNDGGNQEQKKIRLLPKYLTNECMPPGNRFWNLEQGRRDDPTKRAKQPIILKWSPWNQTGS